MGIWYTTRESVMASTDIKAAAYSAAKIDRAIEAASRDAEAFLRWAVLAPTIATYRFDYPSRRNVSGQKLYLNQFPLISATTLTSDGTALTDYSLYPTEGPPYTKVELNDGSALWNGGDRQRNIALTGTWGWSDESAPAGTSAEALDASETGLDMGACPDVGVGTLLKIDSERLIVTGKNWLTTGQTGTLTADRTAQTLAVSDGTAFAAGEVLLLDSERVEVVDISGNNLTVKRSVDGTTLAAHTGATIYGQRTLTVVRASAGTTAATHLTSTAVTRWVVPGPLQELTEAYAVSTLLSKQSGYARTSGAGEGERETTARGVKAAEEHARRTMGRYRHA